MRGPRARRSRPHHRPRHHDPDAVCDRRDRVPFHPQRERARQAAGEGVVKRIVAAATALTALAIAGVAHAAPKPETGWGFPRDISVDGWRIDWLINVTMVFVTILFIVMCIWL